MQFGFVWGFLRTRFRVCISGGIITGERWRVEVGMPLGQDGGDVEARLDLSERQRESYTLWCHQSKKQFPSPGPG